MDRNWALLPGVDPERAAAESTCAGAEQRAGQAARHCSGSRFREENLAAGSRAVVRSIDDLLKFASADTSLPIREKVKKRWSIVTRSSPSFGSTWKMTKTPNVCDVPN